MIRFSNIWEKYIRDECRELQSEELSESLRSGFNNLDSSQQVIDEIISFDTNPLVKKLSASNKQLDIISLESLLEPITRAETNLQLQKKNSSLHGHFIRVIRLGDQYDAVVLKREKQTYDSFHQAYRRLEEALTPQYARTMRNTTDDLHTLVSSLVRVGEQRGILDEIPSEHKTTIHSYERKKQRIDELASMIQDVEQDYEHCSFDQQSLRAIKQLKRKIKPFFSKGLLRKAKDAEFIEGVAQLEELYITLSDALAYPEKHKLRRLFREEHTPASSSYQDSFSVQPLSVDESVIKHTMPTCVSQTQSLPETYSLSLHMHSIGYPENFQYFTLRRTLLERDSWTNKFSLFERELNTLVNQKNSMLSVDDKRYLKSIAEGIYLAIQKPEDNFPVSKAKKSYSLLQTIMT